MSTELQDALERLNIIHDQVARGELYRGYRSWSVGASGVCSLLAAALQPTTVDSPSRFVLYWCVVAALCGMIAASEIVLNYLLHENPHNRRISRRVVGQFVPCLAAGAAVTLALMRLGGNSPTLLPGLWAILFGLGIFSSRPYLPRSVGYIALGYLLAGTWLLLSAGTLPLAAAKWNVGATFGIGQLAAALVLYWNLEREHA
ncbi:MAG: hypothetical protein ACR2IE_04545 [Candidatus Sumerlaeaceae bacterium]